MWQILVHCCVDPLLIHGHECAGTLSNMQQAASVCLSYSVATICIYHTMQNVLQLYFSQFS